MGHKLNAGANPGVAGPPLREKVRPHADTDISGRISARLAIRKYCQSRILPPSLDYNPRGHPFPSTSASLAYRDNATTPAIVVGSCSKSPVTWAEPRCLVAGRWAGCRLRRGCRRALRRDARRRTSVHKLLCMRTFRSCNYLKSQG
jgi:hypothetical protein